MKLNGSAHCVENLRRWRDPSQYAGLGRRFRHLSQRGK